MLYDILQKATLKVKNAKDLFKEPFMFFLNTRNPKKIDTNPNMK